MKYILLILLLSSCGSLTKRKLYAGLAGSLIGSFVGSEIAKETSPNAESEKINKLMGLGLGGVAGYFAGSFLAESTFKEDPRHFQGPDLILPKEEKSKQIELNDGLSLSDLTINPINAYEVPITKDLPENLKDKVYKQIVIEHKIPTQTIKKEDGSTVILQETTALEHRYLMN